MNPAAFVFWFLLAGLVVVGYPDQVAWSVAGFLAVRLLRT